MIDHDLCVTGHCYFPQWRCPACKQGTLACPEDSIKKWSNSGVAWMINEGHMMHDDDHGVFAAMAKCSNPGCTQGVGILGDYSAVMDGAESGWQIEYRYTVKDIHPAIQIIDTNDNLVPELITIPLHRSFALYWRDQQACAATIRLVIEQIAEHLGQQRIVNGRFVNLESRLNNLETNHPSLVEASKAIKNFGNDGVHGEDIKREKLLAAYELLEIELRHLFNDDVTRRQALIATITASN